MPTDVLRLKNMTFYAYHGALPEEKRLGQKFEVDLEIFADLSRAAQSDDVKMAIDYSKVYDLVGEVVMKERFNLIESLAERVAQSVQERFDVEGVLVRVRKSNPPLRGHLDCVEVEIRRGFKE